ncbi:hypothetical protein BH11PSE8_BH11PSE8_42760 [soil metagenome]
MCPAIREPHRASGMFRHRIRPSGRRQGACPQRRLRHHAARGGEGWGRRSAKNGRPGGLRWQDDRGRRSSIIRRIRGRCFARVWTAQCLRASQFRLLCQGARSHCSGNCGSPCPLRRLVSCPSSQEFKGGSHHDPHADCSGADEDKRRVDQGCGPDADAASADGSDSELIISATRSPPEPAASPAAPGSGRLRRFAPRAPRSAG